MAGALWGCGFDPLLGPTHEEARAELEHIRVATIPERSGQILRNYLLDGITPRGVQAPELYTLRIRLSEPRREIAIRRDDTASRIAYTASASFQLVNREGRTVFGGSSASETTFEVTNSEFATLSGLSSARDRVLQELSADIREQIAAYLALSRSNVGR